jgi:hypothetical protein
MTWFYSMFLYVMWKLVVAFHGEYRIRKMNNELLFLTLFIRYFLLLRKIRVQRIILTPIRESEVLAINVKVWVGIALHVMLIKKVFPENFAFIKMKIKALNSRI